MLGETLVGDRVKSAIGNAPALRSDLFQPSEGQTEFRLSAQPAGHVSVFVNGFKLCRGEHFAVRGRVVAVEGLEYSLSATDCVDVVYETIA